MWFIMHRDHMLIIVMLVSMVFNIHMQTHNCAIFGDATYCWGANYLGQVSQLLPSWVPALTRKCYFRRHTLQLGINSASPSFSREPLPIYGSHVFNAVSTGGVS